MSGRRRAATPPPWAVAAGLWPKMIGQHGVGFELYGAHPLQLEITEADGSNSNVFTFAHSDGTRDKDWFPFIDKLDSRTLYRARRAAAGEWGAWVEFTTRGRWKREAPAAEARP